jgi:hypothetical protein
MKILNIASSDNFEDILDAVRNSSSDEVILVVPKSSRVFKNGNKVAQLKNHFEELEKDVSIISSSEEALKNASSAGFNILRRRETTRKRDKDIASLYSEEAPEKKEFFQVIRAPIAALKHSDSEGFKNFIFIFLGLSFLLFIVILLTSFSEAKIRLFPYKKDFSINIPITISNKVTETDEVYGVIPGESIQIEKVVSKNFSAAGEKDVFQKAKGRMTIYNNFGTSPQTLVATTRFQTSEGLVFRITKNVVVPGAVKQGDKLRPGEVQAEVVADRAGDEYNVEPSEFKIPGFLGSPKYQGFYAKSFEKFSGGFIGKTNVATKEEIEKAETSVKEEVVSETKKELALLSNFKILDETLDIETEKTADSNKAGDLGKEFKIGYKAKLRTIAFKDENVIGFIAQYIANSQNLKVIDKGLEINYEEVQFDKENDKLFLNLSASGQAAENIDKEKIISDIINRKNSEAETYLGSLKEIESSQIFLSPFWVRSIPKNRNRIEIQVVTE